MCVHTRVKLMEEITPFSIYGGIDTFVIVLIGQFFDETTENFIELEMNRSFFTLSLASRCASYLFLHHSIWAN